MKKLMIKFKPVTKKNYSIVIDENILTQIYHFIPKNIHRIIIITDSNVKKYYADKVMKELKRHGFSCLLITIPAGEKSKTSKIKTKIEEQMLASHCGHDSLIIALGGGVVGDMAGFVAATYMRGIPYIQVPTSLLAMVDSSVGGKTAINTPQGKNLIGAYWQPLAVIADVNCLKTLPKTHLVNGLIEALKMFLTHDVKSFYFLQKNINKILNGNIKFVKEIIYRAVKIKTAIVSKDEKENSLRMVLNFGHTIAHALENLTNYKILHGYAVALGMLVEAKIAVLQGLLTNENYMLLENMLGDLQIKGQDLKQYDVKQVIENTRIDKKARQGKAQYVLLADIGKIHVLKNKYVHLVSDQLVKKAFIVARMEHPTGTPMIRQNYWGVSQRNPGLKSEGYSGK